MSNNDNSAKAPATAPKASDSYGTPMGVFHGKPQIAYPSTPSFTPKEYVPVGGVILADTPIEYNTNRRTITLKVRNTGDRPIQVGSHYHFFEVNRYLEFDRPKAYGYHLNIPATTAIRFEPGDEKEVELVTYWGKRRVIGFNNLVDGYTGGEDFPTYYPKYLRAVGLMKEYQFKSTPEETDAPQFTAGDSPKN